MLTTLKWSGTSVTVGSLVAATTVRVIAGGAGVVCAAPEAGSAITPSNNSAVVLNCMIASQVQRMIQAPYAHLALLERLAAAPPELWRRRFRMLAARHISTREGVLPTTTAPAFTAPSASSVRFGHACNKVNERIGQTADLCLAITESHQGQTPFRRW